MFYLVGKFFKGATVLSVDSFLRAQHLDVTALIIRSEIREIWAETTKESKKEPNHGAN